MYLEYLEFGIFGKRKSTTTTFLSDSNQHVSPLLMQEEKVQVYACLHVYLGLNVFLNLSKIFPTPLYGST